MEDALQNKILTYLKLIKKPVMYYIVELQTSVSYKYDGSKIDVEEINGRNHLVLKENGTVGKRGSHCVAWNRGVLDTDELSLKALKPEVTSYDDGGTTH